jgi:hypothetical protein
VKSGHTQEVYKDIEGKDAICKLLLRDVAVTSTAVFVLKLECSLNNRTGFYAGSRPYLAHVTRFYVAVLFFFFFFFFFFFLCADPGPCSPDALRPQLGLLCTA